MDELSLFEITASGIDTMLANAQKDIFNILDDLKRESSELNIVGKINLDELKHLMMEKLDTIQERIESRISELM